MGPGVAALAVDAGALSSRVHGSGHGSSGQKAIQKNYIVEKLSKIKKAASNKEKAGGRQARCPVIDTTCNIYVVVFFGWQAV